MDRTQPQPNRGAAVSHHNGGRRGGCGGHMKNSSGESLLEEVRRYIPRAIRYALCFDRTPLRQSYCSKKLTQSAAYQ